MKYIALLRGINVGGNSIIKMSELKEAYEKAGMKKVRTFINSGNVIFESNETDTGKLTRKLEQAVLKSFKIESRHVVVSLPQIKKVEEGVPKGWRQRDDMRRYITFVISPMKPDDILKEITLKEGIDFIKTGPGVLYMSTLLSGITKSSFTKLASKKVYKFMTIRNYTTVQKLLKLMEE